MHWHTVAEWQVDVFLHSETHPTAAAQQVLCAHTGASWWQVSWGALLESREGGVWDATAGGLGILVRRGIAATQLFPTKGAPRDSLTHALWYPTRCCHVLVGVGGAPYCLHAQAAYRVAS